MDPAGCLPHPPGLPPHSRAQVGQQVRRGLLGQEGPRLERGLQAQGGPPLESLPLVLLLLICRAPMLTPAVVPEDDGPAAGWDMVQGQQALKRLWPPSLRCCEQLGRPVLQMPPCLNRPLLLPGSIPTPFGVFLGRPASFLHMQRVEQGLSGQPPLSANHGVQWRAPRK